MTGIARLLYGAQVDPLDPRTHPFDNPDAPPARMWLDHEVAVAIEGHLAAASATGHLLECDVDPGIGQVLVDPESFQRDLDDRLFLALRDAPRVMIEVVARKCGKHVELYVLGGAEVEPPMILQCA